MGDYMANVGFIILNDSHFEVLKLDGAEKLYEVDDFLRNFADEKDFKGFLENVMKVSDLDSSDIFIYSRGKGRFRFSDLIFSKNHYYNNALDDLKTKKSPNYTSVLFDSYYQYSNKTKYQVLFESAFNTCYSEFRDLVLNSFKAKFSVEDFKEIFKKEDMFKYLLGGDSSYNNFRDLVYLRDTFNSFYYKNLDKVNKSCKDKSDINANREDNRSLIEQEIKYVGVVAENNGMLGKNGVIYPDEDLARYQELKKVKGETLLTGMKNQDDGEMSNKIKYILNTLLNEDIFPTAAIGYIGNVSIYYVAEEYLTYEYDDNLRDLSRTIPYDFWPRLFDVKSELFRYNQLKYSEPADANRLFKEMISKRGSYTDINEYLKKMYNKREKGSIDSKGFDTIYNFAKASEAAKKGFGSKEDGSNEKGRTK